MTGPILFLVLGVLVSASVALADAPWVWTATSGRSSTWT